MMRVGAQRNSCTFLSCQPQQTHFEILAIGIAINLDRFIEIGCFGEDAAPICLQTLPMIENFLVQSVAAR